MHTLRSAAATLRHSLLEESVDHAFSAAPLRLFLRDTEKLPGTPMLAALRSSVASALGEGAGKSANVRRFHLLSAPVFFDTLADAAVRA